MQLENTFTVINKLSLKAQRHLAGARRVLIVEDEADLAATLMFALAGEGYYCQSAATGPQALGMAAWMRPDLILLDLNIPGMDGTDVCLHVRSMPKLQATRVIMLTARSSRRARLRGHQVGADAYLCKPFDLPALLEAVQHTLRASS